VGSNLSVKITADVVDLQTKFAVAKAEVSGLASELNKLARASAAGILDPAAQTKLQQVAGDFLAAKNRAAELRAEMQSTREASGGLGTSLDDMRAGLSRAFAITGVAALLEGVMKVGEAIDQLGERAIQIRTLSAVLGVSTSQVQAMQVAAEESGTSIEILARAEEKFTVTLNEARDGSGKAIEKLLALGVTTKDIANPTFQLNDLLAVLKGRLEDTNTADATRKALLQDLGARTALAIEAIKVYDGSLQGVAAAMARVNGLSTEQVEGLKEMKVGWDEITKSISNTAAKAMAAVGGALSAYRSAVLATHPDMNPAITSSGPGRSTSATGEQQAAVESARVQEAAHEEVLRSEMESIKAGVAAFAQGSAERLAALREYASLAKQYYGSANVDEVKKANAELLAEERAYGEAQSRAAISDARERVAEVGSIDEQSALSRAAQERGIWQAALADTRLTAQGRIEVERDIATATTAIHRAAAQEAATIDRQNVQADIAISHLRIEAEKNALDLNSAANSQAIAARLAQLRTLTAAEFTLNNEALQNELSNLERNPAEYNRVYNEIRELKAKLVIDLQKLDKEAADANAKYAKEQGAAWKAAVGEIENIEGTLVSDIVGRRKTMSQSLLQIGADLVQKEIANDLKGITQRLLLEKSGQDADKALKQGGFLYHLLFEQQKTGATVTASQAQSTAVAAGVATQNTETAAAATAAKAQQAIVGPSQVLADAAMAFAGTYASVSSIPVVGWALAPGAAAAAEAAVASQAPLAALDVGAWDIPADAAYHLHAGETVVPKTFAQGMRENVGGGEEGGYSEQHNYGDVNVSALDTRGFASFVRAPGNRQALAQGVRQYLARGGGRR
jgi:hypothetical protein